MWWWKVSDSGPNCKICVSTVRLYTIPDNDILFMTYILNSSELPLCNDYLSLFYNAVFLWIFAIWILYCFVEIILIDLLLHYCTTLVTILLALLMPNYRHTSSIYSPWIFISFKFVCASLSTLSAIICLLKVMQIFTNLDEI